MNVLYKLRGNILSDWSTKNPVLAEREPAIVMIPADSGSGLNEPSVMLKIGDGITAFNDLDYVAAIIDWNAAEGEPGHILNRPFYEESKEVTTTFYPSRWSYNGTTFEGFHLTVGTTYHVSLDGTEYSGVCVAHLEGADKGVMLLETSDAKVMLGEMNSIVSMVVVGIDKPTEVVIRYRVKNVKTIDPKFLPEHLQFGETTVKGDTLTWDGNTEGRLIVNDTFVKISDAVVTANDCNHGYKYSVAGEEFSFPNADEGMLDNALTLGDGAFVCTSIDNLSLAGFVFPETGVYVPIAYAEYAPLTLTIPGYTGFETKTVTLIDPKFLPETASPDWNAAEGEPGHILNRPFYTETTPDLVFTDDDIANPIERIELPDGEGMALVKVSNRVFTADELSGVSATIGYDGTEVRTDNNPLIEEIEGGKLILFEALQATVGAVVERDTDLDFGEGLIFSPGLWLFDYPAESGLKILNITIPGKETIKQLDSKFLNPALQFGTDEQVVITWDGNVTGMEPILHSVVKEAAYYWVSDFAPDASRVYRKAMVSGLQYAGTAVENELMSLNCNPNDPPDDIVEIPNWGIIVYKAGAELPNFSRPFDKTGIYFKRRGDGYTNGYQADQMVFPEVVHPMAEKYMPILTSPNGTRFRITVNDDGTVTTAEVTE